jgi:hypothetical protein
MLSQSAGPDELKRAMLPKLRLGERLLWVGRPDPGLFSREVTRACLVRLGMAALALAAFALVVSRFAMFFSPWVPVALFVAIVLLCAVVLAPWRYRQRVGQTVYAITDRRALVHLGFGWSSFWFEAIPELRESLWSFDASQIVGRRRIERYAGRVDLVFDGERHRYTTGRGEIGDWVQVGFLGLRNTDEVEELLDRQFIGGGAQVSETS